MAKVLFLELDQENEWAVASIGPAFIAAYLRQHGHEVSLLRVPLKMSAAQVAGRIRAEGADVLGVSLTSRQWLRARELMPALRRIVDVPVIAGGLHPTFASDVVLDTPGIDCVCLGEGEQAMLTFVEAVERQELPPRGIQNIRVRGDPMPALRPPFESIDALPFMARDMLDERFGVVHIATQRGCPYPCTYCAARQFSDLYQGSYGSFGRRRSHENVLEELSHLRRHGGLSYIIFLDDTFTINHAWVKAFCESYAERFHIPFSIHARAETVNENLLSQMSHAGCRHIVYGVESGSERVRRDILDRRVSNERLRTVFRWTREAGILATANYMIGIPGETKEDIGRTLALHEELDPDDFGYFVFYPYPGTRLFHLCKERGYLPDNYYDLPANHRTTILTLPNLSAEDIEAYYRGFTEVMIRHRLKKLPSKADSMSRKAIIDQVERFAAQG